MSSQLLPPQGDTNAEISALIETLHQTEQRLEELTAGEVDTTTDHTGRRFTLRRAQDQMRLSETTRQAAILNALPAHIALLNSAGTIISVNEAWQRLAGENLLRGPAYAIGVNYLEICADAVGCESAGARTVANGILAVLRGEVKSFSAEYPCHSPTRQRWFLMTVVPFADIAPLGAVVMHVDTTSEHEAEEGARSIVESALDAVIVMDASGRITGWNALAEKTFGWSREEVVGKLLTETIIPARHHEAHGLGLRAFLATGEGPILNKRIETAALRRDGQEISIEMSVSPIRRRGAWVFSAFIRDLTERKQNEEALRRFATAMDATEDAIYLVDRTTMRYIHVNNAACRMRKQTREELLALGPAGLLSIPEEELARTYDLIIAGGQPAGPVEMLRPRDDGSHAWIELRRHAQRAGKGWQIVSIARDITERKKIADELLESDRRFSDMMGNVDLVSIVIDMVGRIIYCNDYFLALTGWRREELIGKKFVDLIIPPDLAEEVRAVHLAMLADFPAARHHENEILTRAGERRLIRWNNTTLRSPSGAVTGTASIGEDITERMQAENALRTSELHQRHLVEQLEEERSRLVIAQRVAKIGSWETDLVTMSVIWSEETHRIHETDPATFHPTHEIFLMIVHPDDRTMVKEVFDESLNQCAADKTLQHRLRMPDGRIKFAEERWRVFFDQQGRPLRAIGTCQDISERKRAEEEVLHLNASLERRVKERTADLEAVNQELEAFDYSISHDLKAPIRHVEGFGTMLMEEYGDKLDLRGRDCLIRIQAAAQRMEQLVSDLLALSLVSRGELNRQVVDLSALAWLVLAELQKTEPGRDIQCLVMPGLGASGDRGLLRIVLENLLGNAWKFTGKRNAAKIEFGLVNTDDVPVFFVRDNGAGFDASYADKLFAPFQRLHTQSEFKGTGIGLATVRRIITRHGGRVWAESIVDQGTSVHFTLQR